MIATLEIATEIQVSVVYNVTNVTKTSHSALYQRIKFAHRAAPRQNYLPTVHRYCARDSKALKNNFGAARCSKE